MDKMATQRHLDRHIAAMSAAFSAAGFTVQLLEDPEAYRTTVAGIEGYSLTSPLDSAFVDLAGRFLWLKITDSTGAVVGIEVGRSVIAPRYRGGLKSLLLDRSFFGDRRQVLPVLSQPPAVNLSGRLGYMGGAWISPAVRGRGLMSLTAKLTMAHLVRCFPIDHIFGLIRSHHIGLALNEQGYSFTSATELRWSYWGHSASPEALYMIWVDRAALLERYEAPANYTLKAPPRDGGKTG